MSFIADGLTYLFSWDVAACCGGGGQHTRPVAVENGQTMYSFGGISRLPNGVAAMRCEPGEKGSDGAVHCPSALNELLLKRGAQAEFNTFRAELQKGRGEDVEQTVLLKFTPVFEKLQVGLYLVAGERVTDLLREPSWFVFVDRAVNPGYVPDGATRALRKQRSSTLKRMLGYEVPLELESTPTASSPGGEGTLDLTGSWVLETSEGDMDASLKEQGFSWGTRNLASARGYGIGVSGFNIIQSGNSLEFESYGGAQKYMQKVTVGDGEQETQDLQSGEPIVALPDWDDSGSVFILTGQTKEGRTLPSRRFFREGDRMVLEITTPKGVWTRRVYTRV